MSKQTLASTPPMGWNSWNTFYTHPNEQLVREIADAFVLVRPLCGGDYAIGFFNLSDTAADVSLALWDIGLSAAAGHGVDVYDCIGRRHLGIRREMLLPTVSAHGCVIYRCKIIGGGL